MELPRREPGDELLRPGEMARLRMRLRVLAPKHDLTTVNARADLGSVAHRAQKGRLTASSRKAAADARLGRLEKGPNSGARCRASGVASAGGYLRRAAGSAVSP